MTKTEIDPHAPASRFAERSLAYRRAVLTFLGSYALIEIVAAMCSILVAAITHTNFSGNHADVHNHAFVTSERFYPLINLISWMTFAAIYFRRPAGKRSLAGEALRLGAFWLALALPFDVIFFILVKSPYSLSFHDFYVGQLPWIYIVYAVLFVSPLCYVRLFRRKSLHASSRARTAPWIGQVDAARPKAIPNLSRGLTKTEPWSTCHSAGGSRFARCLGVALVAGASVSRGRAC